LPRSIINPPTADVPAGDANTDTLLVAYGNGEGSPEGEVITAINGINSDRGTGVGELFT
jgi:hypothetical protein